MVGRYCLNIIHSTLRLPLNEDLTKRGLIVEVKLPKKKKGSFKSLFFTRRFTFYSLPNLHRKRLHSSLSLPPKPTFQPQPAPSRPENPKNPRNPTTLSGRLIHDIQLPNLPPLPLRLETVDLGKQFRIGNHILDLQRGAIEWVVWVAQEVRTDGGAINGCF